MLTWKARLRQRLWRWVRKLFWPELREEAARYQYRPRIVIQGPRGSGKTTAALAFTLGANQLGYKACMIVGQSREKDRLVARCPELREHIQVWSAPERILGLRPDYFVWDSVPPTPEERDFIVSQCRHFVWVKN